jgi:predicted nucleic-acid-binding protein
MLGIDTNILLRTILPAASSKEDAAQMALVAEMISDSKETFFVNHVVLIETIWVLRKSLKYSNEVIASFVRQLLGMSNVLVYDEAIVGAALDTFTEFRGDFSDHLIGEINRQNGCRTTFTFDRAAARSPNFSELQR